MVITRSQSNRNSRIEQTEMDTFSDEDISTSIPDLSSRNYFPENIDEAMRSQERDHEKHRIGERFMDRNIKIGELTSMVRDIQWYRRERPNCPKYLTTFLALKFWSNKIIGVIIIQSNT